jgi:flagellar M-ring protein FliF
MAAFDPGAVFAQLLGAFMRLPLSQRILFPLLILGSVAGIIAISRWAGRPEYSVLFSDLEPADSAAVVERLRAQNVGYELRGDGRTIAITPPSLVHELRITLSADGIPKHGSVGFELFDSAALGSTTFDEKVKWVRARQGELERTIGAIDAIASARVHISEPEKSIYSKAGSEATASVLIKLKPGKELTKAQTKGIMNLVAGSVDGLKIDNVSIIDTYGNLLSPREDEKEGDFAAEATRIQYQREIEQGYVRRIEQMLAKVLGSGRVVARVTAEVDYSSNEREEESYDPGGQVIRSERSVSEGAAGGAARGGVPGVVSNLSNDPKLLAPQQGADEAGNSKRNEVVKNYELSRAIIKSSSPRGTLERLSVAVLVDGTYEEITEAPAAEGAEPVKKQQFRPLTNETMAQIEDLVKSAVGFDVTRGDSVRVENLQFARMPEELVTALESNTHQYIMTGGQIGVSLIALILLFVIVVRPIMGQLLLPVESEVNLERLLPAGIEALEQELTTERERAAPTLPEGNEGIDLEHLEALIADNSRLVRENPRQAALLIRYWLGEGAS